MLIYSLFFREYRRGNKKKGQSSETGSIDEEKKNTKNNTICVGHHASKHK
jgi:hypothetical protein